MRITANEKSGLRCILQLAGQPGHTLSLSEIAEREGIAEPFTAKMLARLRRAGLIVAVRGRNGGYALARKPEQISIGSVLEALDTPLFDADQCRRYCTSRVEACTRSGDCALRPMWTFVTEVLRRSLETVTLADMARHEPELFDRLQTQLDAHVGYSAPAALQVAH